MKLKDRVAIVTGGGTGIGKAISLAFADEGAAVVVAARNVARLDFGNLEGASFKWANPGEGGLEGTNLHRANLRWDNLERSHLLGAILAGALLDDTRLVGANLSQANLEDAHLKGAPLSDSTVMPRDWEHVVADEPEGEEE